MIRVRYRDSNELSPGLHATAGRHGRTITVYLLPGLTAEERNGLRCAVLAVRTDGLRAAASRRAASVRAVRRPDQDHHRAGRRGLPRASGRQHPAGHGALRRGHRVPALLHGLDPGPAHHAGLARVGLGPGPAVGLEPARSRSPGRRAGWRAWAAPATGRRYRPAWAGRTGAAVAGRVPAEAPATDHLTAARIPRRRRPRAAGRPPRVRRRSRPVVVLLGAAARAQRVSGGIQAGSACRWDRWGSA